MDTVDRIVQMSRGWRSWLTRVGCLKWQILFSVSQWGRQSHRNASKSVIKYGQPVWCFSSPIRIWRFQVVVMAMLESYELPVIGWPIDTNWTGYRLCLLHQRVQYDEPSFWRLIARCLQIFKSIHQTWCQYAALLWLLSKPAFILRRKECFVLGPINGCWTTSNDTCKNIHFPYCPPRSSPFFIFAPSIWIGVHGVRMITSVN